MNDEVRSVVLKAHDAVQRANSKAELRSKELAVVRARNRQLRARVVKLERSRDRWKARATGHRTELMRLRALVASSRASRDLWKDRYVRLRDEVQAVAKRAGRA